MPIAKRVTPTNPILVTRKEAAEMLGVSLDFFKDNVQPELRIVKRGSRFVRVPVEELHEWSRRNSARQ